MGHRIYQRDADAEDYDDDDNDDMHSTYLQPSCHHTSPQHPTAVTQPFMHIYITVYDTPSPSTQQQPQQRLPIPS